MGFLITPDTFINTGTYDDNSGDPQYGNSIPCYDADWVDVLVKVTAVSGTNPMCIIWIETTDEREPGSDDWYVCGVMNRFNMAGNYRMTIKEGHVQRLRAKFLISGTTPSFTIGATLSRHWRA